MTAAISSSSVFPLADIPCADPIEAVLDEADKCGIKVFLGNGFYGDWTKPGVNITSGEVIDRSFKAMDELTEKYAHHSSFYGWYFPDETCIILRFSGNFMKYVNLCSARCHEITPDKKTLIAPYGTNLTLTNSKYIDALASLDVDFIAYQDEIGVKKTRVWQSERIFARLKKPMIKRDAPHSGPTLSCSILRAWSTKAHCSPPISSALNGR